MNDGDYEGHVLSTNLELLISTSCVTKHSSSFCVARRGIWSGGISSLQFTDNTKCPFDGEKKERRIFSMCS